MHDRGKMNVVKNPSSFRNSCSLKEGKVAILRLLQVTKTLIATGPMIQSAMTEWATSPWRFGYWGLLNNQWDKFYATWLEALTLPLPPLPPLPRLLDLAIYFQQEHCCWFRTARQKVQLSSYHVTAHRDPCWLLHDKVPGSPLASISSWVFVRSLVFHDLSSN